MDNSFYIFFTAILAVSIVVWRFFPKFKFFIWISKGSLTQIGVLILIIILIGISFHLLDSYGHGYGVGNYTSASPVKHFFNSVSPEALYLFKNNSELFTLVLYQSSWPSLLPIYYRISTLAIMQYSDKIILHNSEIIYICILWPRSQGISFYPDYS